MNNNRQPKDRLLFFVRHSCHDTKFVKVEYSQREYGKSDIPIVEYMQALLIDIRKAQTQSVV